MCVHFVVCDPVMGDNGAMVSVKTQQGVSVHITIATHNHILYSLYFTHVPFYICNVQYSVCRYSTYLHSKVYIIVTM